jgi:quercetin dioxygenase-like cupin family protein
MLYPTELQADDRLPFYDSSSMKVDHWQAEDGPLTEKALKDRLQRLGYSVTRYIYPPGTYFPDHTHAVEKIDAVVSGQFRIAMGDDSAILRAGDSVHVPRGVAHSAEVIGNEPVVSLDAVRVR